MRPGRTNLMGKNRVEEWTIRSIARQQDCRGTNGIGKPFSLRKKPDWRLLLAFQFGVNGRRLEVTQ